MTTKEILNLSINEINEMDKDELIEITRKLVDVARHRIKKLPKGNAYAKLVAVAKGFYGEVEVEGLKYEDSRLKISQNFKGKDAMSFNQIRALRKTLADYLNNPTSLTKGYEEYYKKRKEEAQKKLDILEDAVGSGDPYKVLESIDSTELGATKLQLFAQNKLAWDSDQIHNAIEEFNKAYGDKGAHWKNKSEFFDFYKAKIEEGLSEAGYKRQDMDSVTYNNFGYKINANGKLSLD